MKKVILIFWLITISISSYKIYETYLFSHDNASFSSIYIEPIPKEIVFLDSGRTGTMEPFVSIMSNSVVKILILY